MPEPFASSLIATAFSRLHVRATVETHIAIALSMAPWFASRCAQFYHSLRTESLTMMMSFLRGACSTASAYVSRIMARASRSSRYVRSS